MVFLYHGHVLPDANILAFGSVHGGYDTIDRLSRRTYSCAMALPHIDYHAVLVALQRNTEHCPLCAAVTDAEAAFWDSTLFSGVGSEGFQDQFLATDGFCSAHARDFARHNDGVAVTMLYAPLLRHRRAWIAETERPRWRRVAARFFRRRREATPAARGRRADRHACLLCDRIDHWTDRFLINLLRHQTDPAIRAALKAGTGLCVRHYRRMAHLSGKNALLGRLPGGPTRVPRIGEPLRTFHQHRWDAVVATAEEEVMGRGGHAWRTLIQTIEGGTDGERPT